MNQIIYDELIRLRDRFREESKASTKPIVCSNEGIEKISEKLPRTKEEILKIEKIDYRYVNYFVSTINNILENSKRFIEVNPKIKNTISELEKKLVDINRRNRMLYFPKIPVTAYDMCLGSADPFDLLFRRKTFKINQHTETYSYFNRVYRDAMKSYRDHGILDVYIAYPFIKGKIDEDFYIHAPLALFPVTLEKGLDYISVKLDTKREVTYNSHLLLANYKFKGVNRPLPNVNVDNLELSTFISNLVSFYENEGITFYSKKEALKRFIQVRSEEFKYYRIGDFSLEGYCVLGRFSSYSTILQHDFDLMINEGVLTDNLAVLLDKGKPENTDQNTDDSEELNYVGELNSSQEFVISEINKKDVLVVEGPPGTGKSQTITSLVTNFLFDNKNVLVVSEKKAALDVVYSRLGNLNKYAILIDDINDKETFYSNLANLLKDDETVNLNIDELNSINEDIKLYMSKFKNIDEKLYKNKDLGIEVSKLYENSNSFDLKKITEKKEYDVLTAIFEEKPFKNINYAESLKAYELFNDDNTLEKLLIYKKYQDTYLFNLKENLNSVSLVDMRQDIRTLNSQLEIFNNANRFKKFFNKGKIKKNLNQFVNKYYQKPSRKKAKLLLEEEINVDYLNDYNDLISAKKIYANISSYEDIYLNCLIKVIDNLTHVYSEANDKLFNYLKYLMITEFENKNNDCLKDMSNYQEIVSNLDNLFDRKKKLVYDKVKYNCVNAINVIKQSESFTDMNHNIMSDKRKPNISRFMTKYFDELKNGVKVWLMTPEVVSEVFPLFESYFDLAIFDEASQLYVEKSLPAIFRAKKVVIAGDSKQLRPSSLGSGRLEYDFDEYSEDNIALEEESLLDVARYKVLPPVVLNFHYRSSYEELINFSNYAFYDENLYISPNTQKETKKAIEVFKVNDAMWVNRSNMREAAKIISLLKDFFKNRQNKETIGIITFNSQQRDLIEDLIDSECLVDTEFASYIKEEYQRKDNGEDIGLFVKNIENVQGDERDVIIFSIGYAKGENGKLLHNFGWLNQRGGENRLNVAITRAKKKIIVVTSILPSDLKVDNFTNEGPKYLKKYLEYCFLISNNEIKTAKQTLYSMHQNNHSEIMKNKMIEDVYQEVCRLGYEVEFNVGVGKYMIDVAIKQNGKYILGLEFDSKLATIIPNYRERDYFRKKYLESRGWNIYRVYSALWWKDKEAELSKICNTLRQICSDNKYIIEY